VLWVNLGLISLTLALAFGLVTVWRPQVAPVGRVVMTLGLQVCGIFVVTWLLVERAQAMGGTCTGEHGIGQGKQKYLKTELGQEAIDAMRAIKQALDPQNIFNPGKIIPAA